VVPLNSQKPRKKLGFWCDQKKGKGVQVDGSSAGGKEKNCAGGGKEPHGKTHEKRKKPCKGTLGNSF